MKSYQSLTQNKLLHHHEHYHMILHHHHCFHYHQYQHVPLRENWQLLLTQPMKNKGKYLYIQKEKRKSAKANANSPPQMLVMKHISSSFDEDLGHSHFHHRQVQ